MRSHPLDAGVATRTLEVALIAMSLQMVKNMSNGRGLPRRLLLRRWSSVVTAAIGAGMVYYAMWLYVSFPYRLLPVGSDQGESLVLISFWLWPVGVILVLSALIIQPPGAARTLVRAVFLLSVGVGASIQIADGWFVHDRLIRWP